MVNLDSIRLPSRTVYTIEYHYVMTQNMYGHNTPTQDLSMSLKFATVIQE